LGGAKTGIKLFKLLVLVPVAVFKTEMGANVAPAGTVTVN